MDISIDSRDDGETLLTKVEEPNSALLSKKGKTKKLKKQNTNRSDEGTESPERGGASRSNNPLLRALGDTLGFEKGDLDSLTLEKSYKLSVLKHLLNGVTAMGSGMGNNSGKYIVKLSKDCLLVERYDQNSKRKETKKVMAISEVNFKFEYKDLKLNQILGATIIVIIFIDNSFWEFKTPRRNKNTFYSSLINFRLNNRDFEGLINS